MVKLTTDVMHVLIIADTNTDLDWINNSFTATGLTVNIINANAISEATSLIRSIKFDMVLYDLAFSEECMAENLKKITSDLRKAPLIVLTNKQGDPEAREALKFGAKAHLVKDQLKLTLLAESFKTILLKDTLNYN